MKKLNMDSVAVQHTMRFRKVPTATRGSSPKPTMAIKQPRLATPTSKLLSASVSTKSPEASNPRTG